MEAPRRSPARRLQSLSGIVPVGAFLVLHLVSNSAARSGPDAYDALAARIWRTPALWAIELFVVALPMAFHAVYGLYLTATLPRGEPGLAPAPRGLAILQRVTGIPLFVFVLFHLWTTRLVQVRDHDGLDLFHHVQALLANPWIRGAWIVGLVAATSHFAAGVWTFSETWGIARSRGARAALAGLAVALFAALTAVGLLSLAAFRL